MKKKCLLSFFVLLMLCFSGCVTDEVTDANENQYAESALPSEEESNASENDLSTSDSGAEDERVGEKDAIPNESDDTFGNAPEAPSVNYHELVSFENTSENFYHTEDNLSALMPLYFREVLFRLEEAHKTGQGVRWEKEYDRALPLFEHIELLEGVYCIKELKLPNDHLIEYIELNLSDYLPQKTSRTWWHNNAYYNVSDDMVYLAAVLSAPETEDELLPEEMLMLVSFKPDNPDGYTVTVYDSQNRIDQSWFLGTYAIEGVLYQNLSRTDICAYNMSTKERRFLDREKERAESILENHVQDFAKKEFSLPGFKLEGIDLSLDSLCAIIQFDDVAIYAGYASDRVNWDVVGTLMTVYIASSNDEVLGVMVVHEDSGLIELH